MKQYTVLNLVWLNHRELYSRQNIVSGVLNALLTQVGALFDYIVSLTFAHTCLLDSVHYLSVTGILFVQMDQVNALLGSYVAQSKFRYFDFLLFTFLHSRTLQQMLWVSEVQGKIMLILVVVHTPINAFLLMSLITGRIGLNAYPIAIPMMGGQLMALLLFHYVTTRYSHKIHAHSKPLIALYVRHGTRGQRGCRMQYRMSEYIERFHCTNRYGITYGGVALISLSSFGKNIVLYARFIIFSYKLITSSMN